nr:anthrone oxygenase family protein [uncultured Chitinophaga sp.]
MLFFLLVITAVTAALMAGLFYAYSCSVNPGLGRLPDAAYLAAMQSINRAILNPVFFVGFMGPVFLLPLSTWLVFREGMQPAGWWLLAATVAYLLGVFGVTMAGNVPLNNALDKVALEDSAALAAHRVRFERPWNRLNTVRTVCAIATVTLVIVACLKASF